MQFIDLGNAMEETKQWAPGVRIDSVFQFGLISGGPRQDEDIARLMLAQQTEHDQSR